MTVVLAMVAMLAMLGILSYYGIIGIAQSWRMCSNLTIEKKF